MARRIPPFAALRAFESAARHGNFRRAGEELSLSISAISHQIKSLEDFLGVSLFRRSGNAMSLTGAGKLYVSDLTAIFDQLTDATARVEHSAQAAQLTINMFPSLAAQWLLPRLNSYRQIHPNDDVRVITTLEPIDFRMEAIDLGVRYAATAPVDFHTDILFVEEMFPVCSPLYLGGLKSLTVSSDLSKVTMIRCTAALEEWDQWFDTIGFTGKKPKHKVDFDSRSLALEAAADGIGLAMGRTPYVERALAAKRLHIPFARRLATGYNFYLVMPERAHRQKSANDFRKWLLAEARGSAKPRAAAPTQISRSSKRSSK
jgi:LysR family glycine cleavage system transcriptional activator